MKNIQSLSDAELEDFIIRQTQKGGLKQNRQKEKITLPSQEMSQAGSFAQGALDSATLGFAPKIIAGIGAPILQYLRPDLYGDQSYQDVYQELRDTGRSEMEAAQQQNPVSYGLGGITGAATLPFPTKTIKGAAGLGALYGGLGALGASDKGEALQLGPENAMDALQGGALGAGLGALGQGIANKFFPKKTPNIEAQERVALGEKFNVPLTKGEALQSETELLKQESAKRGRSGASNATEMQAFDSQRTKEYKQAAQELVSKFTGGKEFTEKGANVGRAVDNLVNKALEEQIEYSNLYQGLKNNVGFIAAKDLKAFAAKALKDLENDAVFIEEAPQAYQKFKSLNKIINKSENINVKRLEAWRQGLNRAYGTALQAGQKENKFALNAIKNKFDGFMDGVIDKAIDTNDTKLLEGLKGARKLTAEWFGKYTAKNKTEYGKKFVQDVIENRRDSNTPYTNEQIVNKIFGSSELGFKPESASIVKDLKKLLPETAFNDIKLEAAQKLITPLLKDTPNVTTYNSNLNQFIKDNPSLAKELFGKEELKDLMDLGKLGKAIFTREKSLINPSGTGSVILDKIKNNKYASLLTNLFEKVETDQGKIKKAAINKESRELNVLPKSALLNSLKTNTQEKQNTQGVTDSTQNQMIQNKKLPELSNLSDEELNNLIARANTTSREKQQDSQGSLLSKIQKVESGNNPNAKNPNSSASGLFQITDGTWKNLSKKYGLTGDKNDPENQKQVAKYLLNENKATLQKALDKKPTDGELYIAHFLGAGDAIRLIKAKDTQQTAARLFPKAAKANKSLFFKNGKPVSTDELYNKLSKLI